MYREISNNSTVASNSILLCSHLHRSTLWCLTVLLICDKLAGVKYSLCGGS